jgi:hypothetical protein
MYMIDSDTLGQPHRSWIDKCKRKSVLTPDVTCTWFVMICADYLRKMLQ